MALPKPLHWSERFFARTRSEVRPHSDWRYLRPSRLRLTLTSRRRVTRPPAGNCCPRRFGNTETDAQVSMFDLIDSVLRLKQGGLPVSVFTLDPDLASTADDNKALARALRIFHSRHPALRIVALMGNLHAGQAEISPFGPTITPAGYLLRDLHPVSVYVANPDGSIWACIGACGVHKVSGYWHRKPGFYPDSPMQGYSLSYMLPSVTASPPADESAETREQAMDGR